MPVELEFGPPAPHRQARLDRIHDDWLAGRDADDPYASIEFAVALPPTASDAERRRWQRSRWDGWEQYRVGLPPPGGRPQF